MPKNQTTSKDCIFCKIVRKEAPAYIVHEDKDVIAFLDIMPANKGHCLVVPKEHFEVMDKAHDHVLSKMLVAAKNIGKALTLSFGSTGHNLLINNGKDAGQARSEEHTSELQSQFH